MPISKPKILNLIFILGGISLLLMSLGLRDYMTAFALGGLASLSPCTLPLIPILAKQLDVNNRLDPLVKYLFGIIAANATIGITIVLIKTNFVNYFQTSVTRITFAVVLMYISTRATFIQNYVSKNRMFRALTINISRLKPKIAPIESSFMLGLTSAFILTPCTTGAFVSTIEMGLNTNKVNATIIMTLFGFGSSLLLALLGFSFTNIKPGKWMKWFEAITNSLIFAIAIDIIHSEFILKTNYAIALTGCFAIWQLIQARHAYFKTPHKDNFDLSHSSN